MREIRLMFWFIVGVTLAAIPMLATAETFNAPWRGSYKHANGTIGAYVYGTQASIGQAQCTYRAGTLAPPQTATYTNWNANYNRSEGTFSLWGAGNECGPLAQYCPAGSSGQGSSPNLTCNSPTTCTLPQVRSPTTGLCEAPQCTLAANAKVGGGYLVDWPIASGVQFCTNGCSTYAGGATNKLNGKAVVEMFVNGAGMSASTCTPGGNQTTPTVQADPATSAPPCAAGQGSYTSPGGVVMCVPGTTPNATVPPVVTQKTSTTGFPDGSSSTTTTTSTCTGDGACSTTTITNNTAKTGGGTGLAGAPGTTTQNENKPSEDTSDFCAKNPTLQMCKGGMNEEVTQKKVLTEMERFNNPGVTDDSGITGKTFPTTKTQELTDEENKLLDTVKGLTTIGSVESDKTAWGAAMESGFFSPVTLAGCTPITSNFAGKVWTLDHCPIAEKISNIGAYALWFMLAIGGFVMLTGGRAS